MDEETEVKKDEGEVLETTQETDNIVKEEQNNKFEPINATDNNKRKKGNRVKEKQKMKKIHINFPKLTKKMKIILGGVLLILIILMIICLIIPRIANNQKVITVGDTSYNKADYMMYLKIVKDAYFGKEIEKIPEATLKTVVVQEGNLTLQRYLKVKAEENLKIAGIIEKMAQDHNIKLSEENLKEIAETKQAKIDELKGKREFYQWLNANETTEEAYDKMLKTEKLYNEIYKALYANGTPNDLTQEEKDEVSKTYRSTHTKIRQIILLTVNPITTEKITDTEKQQKKLLADTIRSEINGTNFDEKIKAYSDNAINVEPPYAVYFTEGQLLEKIEETAKNLAVGQISDVIESEYAYHIIIKDELDNEYLEKLYEEARDKKLLKNISEQISNTTTIIEDALEEIKIK